MSLILDALKKLDREKPTHRDRTVSIAADILGPDLPRPGKRIRLYAVTVFLTAVAATVITYAVVVHFGLPSKSSPSPSVSPQTTGGQVASAPPSREPVDEGRREMSAVSPSPGIGTSAEVKKAAEIQRPAKNRQVAPAPLSRKPVHEERGGQGRAIPRVEKRAEIEEPDEDESPGDSKNSVTPLGEKKASQPVVSGKGGRPPRSTENTAERTPLSSPPASSSFKISGIVWHDEPSRRIAVINGMITHEGSVIEAAKVLKIFPDRVRFSQEGLQFEIPFR